MRKFLSERDYQSIPREEGGAPAGEGGEPSLRAGPVTSEYTNLLSPDADEVRIISSNLEGTILDLQEVLQFTPFRGAPSRVRSFVVEPLVTAHVKLQKANLFGVDWKHYFLEVVDCVMYLKDSATSERSEIADRICFVSIDDYEAEKGKLEEGGSFNELYVGYLEKQKASHCFKIYGPNKIYLFQAESAEDREKIVSAILGGLRTLFSEDLLKEKLKASKELEPLLREQFVIDIQKQELVMNALSQSGIVSDISILSSPDKDKSGVLKMYQRSGMFDLEEKEEKSTAVVEDSWVEYYFVLLGDVLYYFKHSKATLPTGFVSLRFASVDIDRSCLSRGEFIMVVTTPLRSLTLMTKHAVALSTWIAALDRAIFHGAKKQSPAHVSQKKMKRRSSNEILEEIETLQSPVSSLSSCLKNSEATAVFREFLITQKSENFLECFRAIKAYACEPKEKRADFGKKLVERFVLPYEKDAITDLPKSVADPLLAKDVDFNSVESFKSLWEFVSSTLKSKFEKFRETKACSEFQEKMKGKMKSEERKVDPLRVGDKVLGFEIDLKGKGKSRLVRLDMSKDTVTIGRDVSNDIVIDDERVSRSHARIEYNKEECRYLDLGSAHGSKLNGSRFTNSFLQVGDVVTLGSTTLTVVIRDQTFFRKAFGELSGYFRGSSDRLT